MIRTACLGLSRIGARCEVPNAVRQYLSKEIEEHDLLSVAKDIRTKNFKLQKDIGIDIISSNDFSLFDHVLDTSILLGNIPRRYYWGGGPVSLEIYFMMVQGQQREKFDAQPMEIGRWFNTGYLYVIPEISDPVDFAYSDNKAILHYIEGKNLGIDSRPVFLGPVSYLMMSRVALEDMDIPINLSELIDEMLPVYDTLFTNLRRLRVKDIQIDEPMLTSDLTFEQQSLYKTCYTEMKKYAGDDIKINLVTNYGKIGNNLETAVSLPIDSLHIDLVNSPSQLDDVLLELPSNITLSLGLVDAHNVWCNNIHQSVSIVENVIKKIGSDRIIVAPSGSLFLCPLDTSIEASIKSHPVFKYLAFTKQKLEEVRLIADICNGKDVTKALNENVKLTSELMARMSNVFSKMKENEKKYKEIYGDKSRSTFDKRSAIQTNSLKLPQMPITIAGAMPIGDRERPNKLDKALKEMIRDGIKLQEDNGIDVVGHGEFERVNNVEYLASHMDGIIIPEFAYIQHFGYIVIKPPIIWDEISISSDPYVDISKYAMSVAQERFKMSAMGAISFVHGCYAHPVLDKHILYKFFAYVIAKELLKIENVGVRILYIDESSIFQYLPRRQEETGLWINTIIEAFNISCAQLSDGTQVHLHIEYSMFDDIIEHLSRLETDVLLLENARSHGRVFESFTSYKYKNNIGFGVCDPYSDRIPTKPEVSLIIRNMLRSFDVHQIWITTDSGFSAKSLSDIKKIMNVMHTSTLTARSTLEKQV